MEIFFAFCSLKIHCGYEKNIDTEVVMPLELAICGYNRKDEGFYLHWASVICV